MNRPRILRAALAAVALTVLASSCAYETVKPNEAGVKIIDGHFAEELKPGRTSTQSLFHDISVVRWKSGVAQAVFTATKDSGDNPGDDSVKVSSLEAASVALDVTVNYRIDPDQVKCLYTANMVNSDAIRDRLIRPAVQDAFASISSFVQAKEIKTTRKAELANVALTHLKARFRQLPIPIDYGAPVPVTDSSIPMTQTYPTEALPQKTACGVTIESVLIPLVSLPKNIQKAVDAAITAEADAQRITVEQGSATAEAEKNRIAAEGKAAAITIEAAAQADANAKISASMSPGFITLEAAKACADALAKTQAKVASCGGSGGTGGANSTVVIPGG